MTALTWPVTTDLVDDVLASYGEWRGDAQAAVEAYTKWSDAPADEEARRFAAYTSALDREEQAAGGYARAISELERWQPHLRAPQPH